jgi:hypothetical protein
VAEEHPLECGLLVEASMVGVSLTRSLLHDAERHWQVNRGWHLDGERARLTG